MKRNTHPLSLRGNMKAVLIVLLVISMVTAIGSKESSQATTTIKGKIIDEAENGLLLYVLAAANHRDRVEQFVKVEGVVNDRHRLPGIPLQAICWLLLGLRETLPFHPKCSADAFSRYSWENEAVKSL